MSMSSVRSNAFSVIACALLATACGANDSAGTDVGAVRVRVEAASGGPELTRIHLSIAPSGAEGDLTLDAQSGEWGGTFTVVTGAKTVTATAYAGEDVVGTTSADVTVQQHRTVAVAIMILDATTRPGGADHGPIVGSVVASNSSPEANDEITVTASAVDPDGHAVAYTWTDSCGGVFADASAATTSWHSAEVESCTITARATANGLSHELSVPVATQPPTGAVAVSVEFVPAPYVASLALTGGELSPSCTVARTATDASCRPALTAGTVLTAAVSFDRMPAGSGATVALTSDCGGATATPVVDLEMGTASFTWTAPPATSACLVTATVSRAGLTDALTVGLSVVSR
jgi:hypothetical protein